MPREPPKSIPPELRRSLGCALGKHNLPTPPAGVPWEKQLETLEERKRQETEYLLRVALSKLSLCDPAAHREGEDRVHREHERLRTLLLGLPAQ